MKKTCLLCGVFNYDRIMQREYPQGFVVGKRNNAYEEHLVMECVGGTCGNVSTMLPYLGVQTFPIGHFDLSDQGRAMTEDLKYYGADVRFVQNSEKGGTTLLQCTHKLDPDTGLHAMGHRGTSPNSQFPARCFIKTKGEGEAPDFIKNLDFVPDVYFLDVCEAGPRYLAEQLRERGALVYFEPESDKDKKKFDKVVAASDIVKFSGTNISDLSFCNAYTDKLFVMTMGVDGLEFKWGSGDWIKVAAPKVEKEVDWEGAGDWLTSKTIALLCEKDLLDKAKWNEEVLRDILAEASRTAAHSVTFMTPKGMIDAEKGRRPRVEIPEEKVPTQGIIGAICGDILGSYFESRTHFTKKTNFKFFHAGSLFTDDTTMTLAIARWLQGERTMEKLEEYMVDFFPMCTKYRYGHLFREWYLAEHRVPYGAASNGSAMRVSPVAWVAHSLDECLELAKQTADITHNSQDGEYGAMSVAAAIYMARTGKSKAEIKKFIEERFGYNLDRKTEDIRVNYTQTSIAAKSVPEAIICYLEANSYEEAVRLAVSLGGDADTQAAIAGSIAAATPGMEVPKEIAVEAISYLTDSLKTALLNFEEYLKK